MSQELRTTENIETKTRWEIVKQKILAASALRGNQGAICSRLASGRRVWSVRFRVLEGGRRVQKAIYLGDDPEVLRRAHELLERIRYETSWPKMVAKCARLAASVAASVRAYRP